MNFDQKSVLKEVRHGDARGFKTIQVGLIFHYKNSVILEYVICTRKNLLGFEDLKNIKKKLVTCE